MPVAEQAAASSPIVETSTPEKSLSLPLGRS